MPLVVVPFRRQGGKSRLGLGPEIAQAMLEDVVEAAAAVGRVVVADGEGGQGAAVANELRRRPDGPALVVNADLPCATARDLFALLGGVPPGGIAIVEARDGTTNAIALSSTRLFADLYGPGSAARFRAHAPCETVAIPNLVDDVDTLDDLERVAARVGPRTAEALAGAPV
jgi:2-phospho-L-lactate guanylyltransferase (CobY/MobA/RfbA family)